MKNKILIGLSLIAMTSCTESAKTNEGTDEKSPVESKGYTIDCDFGSTDISKAYLSQYQQYKECLPIVIKYKY